MAVHAYELAQPGAHQTAAISRRALLGAALATAAVGGCALARKAIATPSVTIADSDLFTAVPGLAQAFARDNGRVHFVSVPSTIQTLIHGPSLPAGVTYWMENVGVDQVLGTEHLVALDPLLRKANFDAGVLLPGTVAPFAAGGHQYGLPVQQFPLAVRWNPAAFAAAGLSPPAADWSLDAFETVCSGLAAAITAGKVPQAAAVLPPIGAMTMLQDPAIWVAFALGFGGTVVENGRFAIDQLALSGLARLVDILRRFAAPSPATRAASPTFALTFDTWQAAGQGGAPQGWSYARLPRFPVRPVITTRPVGEGIYQAPKGTPDPTALGTAVDALVWLYGATAQRLLAAAGYVPVLADPATQRAFWRAQAPADQAVGDWRNFQPFAAGWPMMPNPAFVFAALVQALAEPQQLSTLIAGAVQRMNATLPSPTVSTGTA